MNNTTGGMQTELRWYRRLSYHRNLGNTDTGSRGTKKSHILSQAPLNFRSPEFQDPGTHSLSTMSPKANHVIYEML